MSEYNWRVVHCRHCKHLHRDDVRCADGVQRTAHEATVSNVIELVQPIEFSTILAELHAMTGPETTGLCIIASTGEDIKVRTFGEPREVIKDVQAAAKELAHDP